uniref:UBC core domain-containing protein n=1 Tax=Panagrolaimus sp. JU765 TaxID=591449 RepID=A0AC34RKZ8_9BILA
MTDGDEPMPDESSTFHTQEATPGVTPLERLKTGLAIKQFIFLESAQSFLIITPQDEAFLLPSDSQVPFKVAEGASLNDAYITYASSRKSLVFHNNCQVTIRRDMDKVFALQTAFDSPNPNDAEKLLEFPFQEAMEWVKFLKASPLRFTDYPEFKSFIETLGEKCEAAPESSNGFTIVVRIAKCRELFTELENYARKALKEEISLFPVFPLLFWLIERLRWVLNPNFPYHAHSVSDDPNRMMVDVSVMNSEAARVLSFYRWPHMNFQYALPGRLAETGFFFQPGPSGEDRVVCFSCSISLVTWESNDEPLQEHERHHSSHCRFMDEFLSENVPLGVTSSILPPLKIGCKKDKIVVRSTLNASAEFFAFGDSEGFSSTARLNVFHMDSAPLQLYNCPLPLFRDFKLSYSLYYDQKFDNTLEFGRITSLSIAGKERFIKVNERDDADADCLLYVGVSVNSKAMKNYPNSQQQFIPFIFVYKISRHLKEKIDPSEAPKRSIKTVLSEFQNLVSDIGEPGDPLTEEVHFPDDEMIENDFWSSDELMDDSYDFKNKMSKKTRAKHEEPNPFVDVDYSLYKVRPLIIGSVDLSIVNGTDWIVEHIVTSDVDNGLVAAVLSNNEGKSEIILFPRCNDSHRFGRDDVKNFTIPNGKVSKLMILPVDHFASYRAANMSDPEPFGPNIAIGSILILLSTKELILFDSASGTSVLVSKNTVDFAVDDKQNTVVADMEGNVQTIHIAAPLTAIQSEKVDELALHYVASTSSTPNSRIVDQINEEAANDDLIVSVVDMLNSLPVYRPFNEQTLHQIHEIVQSKPIRSLATQARVMTSKTTIAALESFLQHSLGFQMVAPPHWVESVQPVQSRLFNPMQSISSENNANASIQSMKESLIKDEKPLPTRAWKFNSEKESMKPAYVFEMAILPCKPLSHINFKFTFTNASNGAPDINFTIYRSKQQKSSRTFGSDDVTRLIPYCNDPSILENDCVKVLPTMHIKHFVDLRSTSAVIQINMSTILDELASASLDEEWYTKPVLLYLMVEVSNHQSLIQQINARTTNILNANRSKNKMDKSKSSRSQGMTKKKLAYSRKAIILKNQKPFTSMKQQQMSNRLNISKRKDTPLKKGKTEEGSALPKSGILLIEEFSITVYRTADSSSHSHLQRLLLQKDQTIQNRLLELTLRKSVGELGYSSMNDVYMAQQKALDILVWVVQNWRLMNVNMKQLNIFLDLIIVKFDELLISGFVTAPKRIAQRWNVLISQLLKIIVNMEDSNAELIFEKLFILMKNVISNHLGKFEKSGSLHWFLSTIFAAVHESTYMIKDGAHIQAANEIVAVCENVLKELGDVTQKKWIQSLHHTLSSKYGLSGFVFDLNMYDMPQQVMGIRTTVEGWETDFRNSYKPNYGVNYQFAQQPTYAQIASMPAMTGMPPRGPLAKQDLPLTEGDLPLASGKLFPYNEHETMSFLEMLNLNVGNGNVFLSRFPWMQTVGMEPEWFDMEEKPDRNRMNMDTINRYNFVRFPIGPELMPGLLESEPLTFTCSGPSDYISVYNTVDNTSQKLAPMDQCSSVPSVKAPEIVQLFAALNSGTSGEISSRYQLSNDIYSLFKQPADLVLCAERVTAQCKRCVVLDFGGPTLLTDFIIPPCEYLYAVYVDCWWYNESNDETRIASSTEIGFKSLIVSNLYPGILLQKVKLTFVLRAANGKVRIPVGRFFGQKWLTNAELTTATLPYVCSTGEPVVVVRENADEESVSEIISMLKCFCEEVRCRYNMASSELQKLIEEETPLIKVKDAYSECFNLRLQWNIAYGVMNRFRNSAPESMIALSESFETRSWEDYDIEHLKSLSSIMINFSNQMIYLLDLRDSVRDVTLQHAQQQLNIPKDETSTIPRHFPTTILTLDNAVNFFKYFCFKNVPILQAQATAHLFKAGCFTSWWGDFFPAVLRKHFFNSDDNPTANETFLLLTVLCAQSVKHSYLQQVVMEKLFEFIVAVANDLMLQRIDQYSIQKCPLLNWTLQLLSTAFDVVASNKRKTDRWSFLAGLFGQTNSSFSSVVTNYPVQTTICSGPMSSYKPFHNNQFSERLYQRWKELFNNEEFSSELEKPQFIAKRLDILADRLQYLFALMKEQVHGIPAVMPPKSETFFPSHIATSSCQEQSSSNKQTSSDSTVSRFSYVPLHNYQGKIRVRQYSARLKISETLCLSVVHTLIKLLLLDNSNQFLPHSSQLLAVKIISKICIHGSSVPIPLNRALGDTLYDLIFKLLKNSDEYEWMRHALLMLLVDLTDAEMRVFGRVAPQTEAKYEAYKSLNEDEEMEVEAKRHKPDVDVEVSEDNSILTADQDQEMDDVMTPESVPVPDVYGPEGCKTAVASGILDQTWSFAQPTNEFVTFSHFDKPGDDIDEWIIKAAMATLIGATETTEGFLQSKSDPSITYELRFNVLLNWMYRLARYYYDRGDSLTMIFHYFDEALKAEEDFYQKSLDVVHYCNYSSEIVPTGGLKPEDLISTNALKLQVSNCAMHFTTFLNTYCTEDRRMLFKKVQCQEKPNNLKDALNFRFFQALLESKYSLRIYGIRQLCREMNFPDSEVNRFIQGHFVRFRHKLPELTSVAVDALGEKMISADPVLLKAVDEKIKGFCSNFSTFIFKELQDNRISLDKLFNIYAKFIFVNSTWPGMDEFSKQSKIHVLSELSLLEFNSATGTPVETAVTTQSSLETIQSIDTAELKCALENLSTEDHFQIQQMRYNYASHIQFEGDLSIATESNFILPQDFVMDSLSSIQFGYQANFEFRCKELLRSALARNCIYNFVPHCLIQKKSPHDENKDAAFECGVSVKSVVHVIDKYLSKITKDSPSKVNDVLLLYLEYIGSVNASIAVYNGGKSSSFDKEHFTPPFLSGKSLLSIMNFTINSVESTEQLWQSVLASLSLNMKDASLLLSICPSIPFQQFLNKFLKDSLHPYGTGTAFGPTTLEYFGTFLKAIIDLENQTFVEQFIDVLNNIFEKSDNSIFGTISVESLLTAVEIVGLRLSAGVETITCDVRKIALLIYRTIEVIKVCFPKFESSLKSYTFKPNSLPTTQLCSTNMCFTILTPNVQYGFDNMDHPTNSQIILPKLTFTTTKAADLTQKKSKCCKPMHPFSSLEPFEYESFEPPPGGFDSYRTFCGVEQVSEKNVKNRMEMLFTMLLKMIEILPHRWPVGVFLVNKFPQTLSTLINLLNNCDCAVSNFVEIRLSLWKPQTLADFLLFRLLNMANDVHNDFDATAVFVKYLVQAFFFQNQSPHWSTPVIFALITLVTHRMRRSLFLDQKGHIRIAEQLKVAVLALTDRWPSTSNLFNLGSQLTNLANEVNGIVPQTFDCRSLPNKTINNVKVYNFAPYAKITGQGPTANLPSILNDPIPNRRSRSAAYSYVFLPHELWMSLTITLPCQIMCYEIAIRCHQYAALNSPSAIQVEVSEGSATKQWILCGGQVNSGGLLTTTIDMSKHRSPIGAIRLFLRRPNAYTTSINLSQILVYGTTTNPQLLADQIHERTLMNWLIVFDKFQEYSPSPWEYAPYLPEAFMRLFIRITIDHKVHLLLRRVVFTIERRTGPEHPSIMELVMNYLFAGGKLAEGVPPIASAELLHSFCIESMHMDAKSGIVRQKQLLRSIMKAQELYQNGRFDETSFAIMLWASACIIWTNVAVAGTRYQTIAECTMTGRTIILSLWNFTMVNSTNSRVVTMATNWLICSLCRAAPDLTKIIMEQLLKMENSDELMTPWVYSNIGKIFQSDPAATHLINSGFLTRTVSKIIDLSKRCLTFTSIKESELNELSTYIEFIADIIVIQVVCEFFQQDFGQEFFKHIFSALVVCTSIKTEKKTSNCFAKLDQSVVKICQRCISYSDFHRKTIAAELKRLLMDDNCKFGGRLDGTLLQLIIRLVLEDELVIVLCKGLKGPNFEVENFKDQLIHPVFGCSNTHQVLNLSSFTVIRDLIPLKNESSVIRPRNVSNPSSFYDEFAGMESLVTLRRKMEPESQESIEFIDGVLCEEMGYKNVAAKVVCTQISRRNAIKVAYNLKQLTQYIAKRTTPDLRNNDLMYEQTCGYNALLLFVRACNKLEFPYDPSLDQHASKEMEGLTMLQHFAIVGGFASLSKYFPMADHFSAVMETYESLSKKQRDQLAKAASNKSAEAGNGVSSKMTKFAKPNYPMNPMNKWSVQPSVVQLHADINNVALATQALQQQVQSVLTHVGSSSSSLQAMIAGTPVSLNVIEPSAIVTYANGDSNNPVTTIVPKSNFNQSIGPSAGPGLSYPDQMSQAIYSMIGNGQLVFAPMNYASSSKLIVPNTTQCNDKDVPAYTIFTLSMFLKLDYYAIALVTCDRFQAKRVLRAAMGLTNTERDITEIISNFKLVLPKALPPPDFSSNFIPERKHGFISTLSAGKADEKPKKEAESLTIYPFFVLEKIWSLSGPSICGKDLAQKIRNAPETTSILDVILLCASQFSNISPKARTAYSPSSDAQAISQIFELSDQIDSLRDSMSSSNNSKPPQPPANYNYAPMIQQMTMMMDGNSVTNQGAGNNGQDFWAKGTGFGSGTTQVQWNLNEHVRRRKLNEEAVTCMINTISGYLMPAKLGDASLSTAESNIGLTLAKIPYEKAAHFHKQVLNPDEQMLFDFELAFRIYNSCLMPIVHSYLTNDSVFDISKHINVYEACIWFVITLAGLNPIIAKPEEMPLLAGEPKSNDLFAALLLEPCAGESVYFHIKKMHQMIKAYLATIDKERNLKNKQEEANDKQASDEIEEENLEVLESLLSKAIDILGSRLDLDKITNADQMDVDNDMKSIKSKLSFDELYISEMKPLQYESIPFLKDDNKTLLIPHHFSAQFLGNKQIGNPKRMRRLAQEAITLSSSLPLSTSSSVFLRASDERLDVFKVLITGPAGTPYANGCFEFDAYFPPDYPNVPVQISLQTTGNNTVRFNPNLYNDGKVCLSVLNTWHGRPEERWNAETSSFLQVIVSIQSLILVTDPYFNEPGYERSRNTPAGQQASRDYDANIRAMTVRWAILENLRNPPKAFEDVVKRHFYLKKDEIMSEIKDWVDEMQKVCDENPEQADRTIKNSLAALKRSWEMLKEEFSKMPPPKGLEEINIPAFVAPLPNIPAVSMECEPPPGSSNKPILIDD